jgi:hypothetical protein
MHCITVQTVYLQADASRVGRAAPSQMLGAGPGWSLLFLALCVICKSFFSPLHILRLLNFSPQHPFALASWRNPVDCHGLPPSAGYGLLSARP